MVGREEAKTGLGRGQGGRADEVSSTGGAGGAVEGGAVERWRVEGWTVNLSPNLFLQN